MTSRGDYWKKAGPTLPQAVYCNGKRRYASFEDANRVAKRQHRHDASDGQAISAYHCRACHGFHVGSKNALARQQQIARRRSRGAGDEA